MNRLSFSRPRKAEDQDFIDSMKKEVDRAFNSNRHLDARSSIEITDDAISAAQDEYLKIAAEFNWGASCPDHEMMKRILEAAFTKCRISPIK